MKVRAHHYLAATIVAAITIVASNSWYAAHTREALATCSTGSSVQITSPTSGATVAGIVDLVSHSTAINQPTGVTYAISAPTTAILGNASPTATTTSANWVMHWDSASKPDGSYQLIAIYHFGPDSASDCTSPAVPFYITNQPTPAPAPTLSIAINPTYLSLAPGQQATLTVSGTYTSSSGVQQPVDSSTAGFAWSASGSRLNSPGSRSIVLTAGPEGGSFVASVIVTMNGISKSTAVPVKIIAPSPTGSTSPPPTPPTPTTSPTAPPPAGTVTPLSLAKERQLANDASVFRPTAPTNANPAVSLATLSCLQQKLGSDYSAISSGQVQPTAAQRKLGSQCFSGSDRIPTRLAPVEPAHISEVTQEKAIVSLTDIKNSTQATNKSAQGTHSKVILVSGTSVPNSDVFIYVFSDPMVLRAQADNNGKWSYVLDNPLKPGKHEVYAVASKDSSSFVRSSALPITIAAAGAQNQDGSLVLESKLQPVQTAFILGSGFLVILAVVLALRLRRHSIQQLATPATTAAPAPLAPTPPASIPTVPTPAPPPQRPEDPPDETKP